MINCDTLKLRDGLLPPSVFLHNGERKHAIGMCAKCYTIKQAMRNTMLPLPEISSWIGESEIHKAQVDWREEIYPDMATGACPHGVLLLANPERSVT